MNAVRALVEVGRRVVEVAERGGGWPVELVTEPPERVSGLRGGHLGVDLHRERDAAMSQDAHSHAGMDLEGCQQRTAGSARVVDRDAPDAVPGAPSVKVAVDVPWAVR